MNHSILLADVASDLIETGKHTAETFSVDWPHFISQVISFCIVAVALYYWAYRPILTVLAERRKRIADGLANAEKIKAELARTEASRLEVLNQANTQANKLIEEARAAAARVREQETQKALADAAQIVAKAREESAAERARMLVELRREVGRLVVDTTGKVTGKILTPDDQRRLEAETVSQLAV